MHHHDDHDSRARPVDREGAQREKNRVAAVSVVAALVLTLAKVAVGLWTGSLGVLAEAMHSGLDLAAAVVTLWAVRLSSRPADQEHAYGHGKIENLSALFETALLLATSAWIIKEAVERLFYETEVRVDANLWSFLVVLLSIAVDFTRSRALQRVAKKYDSQALEADALHFATDIWSSLVVLLGLGGVRVAHAMGLPWLTKADAVAALGVAVVVVWVSLKLGRKAIADLLDTVPANLAGRIASLARVEGVREARQVRVRRSGPEIFVDLVLVVDGAESLERAHAIANAAEAAIKHEQPGADVVIHVEPTSAHGEDILGAARRIASAQGAAPHNLALYQDPAGLALELHLEMEASLPLREAHERASAISAELRRAHPRLARVTTHIEPAGGSQVATSPSPTEAEAVRVCLLGLPELTARGVSAQDIEIRRTGSELTLSFRCLLPALTSVREAHNFTLEIERSLRSRAPNLGRVMVRTEPSD
jgi:cation diffusion facilitator family transporter